MTDNPSERPDASDAEDLLASGIDQAGDVEGTLPADAPDTYTDADAPRAQADPADGTQTRDAEQLLAERTEDLQRVQAEYVNYKKRVDRDRALARTSGVEAVLADLLPVFDALEKAEQHGELTGAFRLVADELGRVATRHGLAAYGAKGDVFDPQQHDALMQVPGEPGATEAVVGDVLQTGYRVGDRIVRHARVAVAEPA